MADSEEGPLILQLVISYCLKLMNISASSWYLNPMYKVVLAPIIHQLCSDLQLFFPESLLAALTSDAPPPIQFFLNLPTPKKQTWGIYLHVLVDLEGGYHL